jgi:hypothetical protein
MRHGTYSIVALDPTTGELGAAVQSHWFSVGSLCTWARPGVGAVATQSVVEAAYGPRVLDRIEAGASAHDALAELIAAVTGVQVRIRAAQQLLSTPLPNPLVVAALEEERERYRTTLDQLAEL